MVDCHTNPTPCMVARCVNRLKVTFSVTVSVVQIVLLCVFMVMMLLHIPPDGLVKGCTEDLVVVPGEAQTGHTFAVSVLKSAQA